MLERCQIMHLGLVDEGGPYVVPLNYGWEEAQGDIFLYFHSARDGRKVDCMKRSPSCFVTITGEMRLITAPEACGWSAGFESLMMEGDAEILQSGADIRRGLDALMRHYGFEGQPEYDERVLEKTTVCRIRIKAITGKRRV